MSPGDGAALGELAKLEEATGDIDGARRDFTKAADVRGIDLDTAQHLVSVSRKANDPKALADALQTLSRIDKESPAAELELAELYANQKDLKNAEAHYKVALDRDPKNAKARLALARLYRDNGKTREAIETYQALAASPGAPAEAKGELDPLIANLKLPEKPISGDVNKINSKFTVELMHFYKERLKSKPGMKGTSNRSVVNSTIISTTRRSVYETWLNGGIWYQRV